MNTKRLASLMKLDAILIVRNKILLVTLVITALYAAIFQVLPETHFHTVVTLFIFTDPVMLGFLFIGVMMLFEKQGNTLQAMIVSPVSPGEYIASKAITLTILALLSALVMGFAAVGFHFHILFMGLAVVLSSLLFIFFGFVAVSKVQTFNQYFIVIPLFMIPCFLPLLNYFGITNTIVLYVIPTQASLILFEAAFNTEVALDDKIYALVYLPLSLFPAFALAKRMWRRSLIN
jgi:fluoroquinolone transport system permease protein